uniref:uncharacterized protein LOC122597661 n=1 Tax=Erigeron canadensis TaxID=72917 RepID=UPI001CB98581|nr:uncharacterized protein LOC122597661 [Erigeron canadensis]
MANIFASQKQHSLFPITGGSNSSPRISKDDYRLFYQEERALFTFLYMIMQKEVIESMLVIGFLIWLEREGYTSYNLVQKMVNRLTVEVITLIVDHIVICLKLMQTNNSSNNKAYNTLASCCDISLLESFLDRKSIHLEEFYHNGDLVFEQVFCIGREVCVKAFDDIILDQSVRRSGGKPSMMIQFPRDATVRCLVDANQFMRTCMEYQQMGSSSSSSGGTYNNIHHQYAALVPPITDSLSTNLRQKKAYDGSRALSLVIRDQEEDQEQVVPPEDRTIFLTFSKGYPIPENEVREYFTRMFGAFIISIHMQSVDPDDQPLYARIVARSPSMVRAVVERDGPHGKSKYTINGKHVWARKFVPRTSSSSHCRESTLHYS